MVDNYIMRVIAMKLSRQSPKETTYDILYNSLAQPSPIFAPKHKNPKLWDS